MNKLNNKGSILLIATIVLYLVIVLGVNFSMVNINELNYSRQYYHSATAFWLAEAGINMYIANPGLLDNEPSLEIEYGNGKIILTRDDSQPSFRYINAIGINGVAKRKIQIAYPAYVPDAYKNSMSTNGNIEINGSKTMAFVNGNTRVSGSITGTSQNANVIIDDAKQGVDQHLTSLTYSNTSDDNAKNVFINNNKSLIASYPPDEVLIINNADSYTLSPDAVKGKKIVYLEGNGIINTSGLVQSNQNLTIITSGSVTFNQDGNQPPNSQLNIIAWDGYNETASASSTYRGLIYTHGKATFDNIKADSVTNGGVIADGGIILGDIWSTKIFNYADMTSNGFYPAGFENLSGGSTMGVASKPISWRELPL